MRGLHLEPFEDRILLDAGGLGSADVLNSLELVSVLTNEGSLLTEGDTAQIAPRDLTLRFNEGQVIDPATLSGITVIRGGEDRLLGTTDDVTVNIGWIGIAEEPNEVVIRFGETLPDDLYSIEIAGSGTDRLMNIDGVAFHNGVGQSFEFNLDLGAQVTSVIPQPITRGLNIQAPSGALLHDGDKLTISDGFNSLTFEFNNTTQDTDPDTGDLLFDNDGNPIYVSPQGVLPGNIQIDFDKDTTGDEIAAAIVNEFAATNATLPVGGQVNAGVVLQGGNVITTFGLGHSFNFTSPILGQGQSPFVITDGALEQHRNVIEVYFTDDTLPANLDPSFFTLLATNETADSDDDQALNPTSVDYNAATNRVVLTFADDLDSLFTDPDLGGAYSGTLRLRIGNEYQPVWTRQADVTADPGDTFYTAHDVSGIHLFGTGMGPESLILSSTIDPQYFHYQFPGGNDEPGSRDLVEHDDQRNEELIATDGSNSIYGLDGTNYEDNYAYDRMEDVEDGIATIYYNFAPYINGFDNLITPAQKNLARQIFDLYGSRLGVTFVEHDSWGIQVATADLQAIGGTSLEGGQRGVGGYNYAVMDFAEDWDSPDFGSQWFETAMHEIGHCLGITHGYELVDGTLMGNVDGPDQIYPGNEDLVHGQYIFRPDSIDIDLYRFSLDKGGLFKAEIFAERQNDASLLDSQLILFEQYTEDTPGGLVTRYRAIAQNDDLYNSDSSLELYLKPGTYFVGVSASGNDAYDPNIADTGLGGVTQGKYDLRMDFTPDDVDPEKADTYQADPLSTPKQLTDATGTYFDGDADGVPGGVYNYWMDVQDAAHTIYVDKVADVAAADGSIANPLTTIEDAFDKADAAIKAYQLQASQLRDEADALRDQASAMRAQAVHLRDIANDISLDQPALAAQYNEQADQLEFGYTDANNVYHDGAVDLEAQATQKMADALPLDAKRVVVRIVGNNAFNDSLIDTTTLSDNKAYEIGLNPLQTRVPMPLEDGETMHIPRNVTTLIDAGAVFKLSGTNITVGSTSQGIDKSGASLQVLGTPFQSVHFTSYLDEVIGVDHDIPITYPTGGDWGGLVFRNDMDYDFIAGYDPASGLVQRKVDETQGAFLNYVNHADIRYGGGKVNVLGDESVYTPINMIQSRPTVTFNTITLSADAAMSADPNAFEESQYQSWDRNDPYTLGYNRVGPEIHGNTVVENSINGLFVRINTPVSNETEELTVNARFDDTDIVHVVAENIILNGEAGGARVQEVTAPGLRLHDSTQLEVVGTEPNPTDPMMISDGDYFFISDGETTVGFEFNHADTPGEYRDGYVEIAFDPLRSRMWNRESVANAINQAAQEYGLQVSAVSVDFTGVVDLTCTGPRLSIRGVQGVDDFDNDSGHGTKQATLDARLQIDPGTIVKLNHSRFEAEMGAQFVAEGLPGYQIVFTSLHDYRYGAGGTFNTPNDTINVTADPQPDPSDWMNDWSGLYFAADSRASLDYIVMAGAGGTSAVGGSAAYFNPVQIRQAEVRITNSRFEYNGANSDTTDRNGRGNIDESVIYVLGAQPIIVGNDFLNNEGSLINIDVNSMTSDTVIDTGRTTGHIDRFAEFDLNAGPMIRWNRFEGNDLNGLELREAALNTESIWDDTDMVHIVDAEIIVDNYHHEGGLTLKSSTVESLVVKLDGNNAGFTAKGTPDLIDDRIGGIINIMGTPEYSVVFTSLSDDAVGAGFDLSNQVQFDTNNNGADGPEFGEANPGDWRSIKFDNYSNDRNVGVYFERELPYDETYDKNAYPQYSELLGQMSGDEKAGDDNVRMGFEVHGAIRTDAMDDADVYAFEAPVGTEIWIDIDYSTYAMDTIVELIDGAGNVLARSDNSTQEQNEEYDVYTIDDRPMFADSMDRDFFRQQDFYSINQRDAGMRLVLPGDEVGKVRTFYVRVRSSLGITNIQSSDAYSEGDQFTLLDDMRLALIADNTIPPSQKPGPVTFEFRVKSDATDGIYIPAPIAGQDRVYIDLPNTAAGATEATAEEMSAAIVDAINAAADKYNLNVTARLMPNNDIVLDGVGTQFNFDPNPTGSTDPDAMFRVANAGGDYQLQIRNREQQEVPGGSVQYADIRYATNGVEVYGYPQHSPLLGEVGEIGDASNTFGGAQDIGNLAQSDQAAISVAGYLSSHSDVDWYVMELDIDNLSSNSENYISHSTLLSTIFDLDFASGMSRPDMGLYVFNQWQELILIGSDSNVSDDLPEPIPGAQVQNIERGSVEVFDPFVGSAELIEGDGRRYYIAVTTDYTVPDALADSNPATRRQPVDSINRVVEEHFDWYTTMYSGPLFGWGYGTGLDGRLVSNQIESQGLELYPEEFQFGDVNFFVSLGNDLGMYDPSTGYMQYDMTTVNTISPYNGNTIDDVDIRPDGRLTVIPKNNSNTSWMWNVDTGTGTTANGNFPSNQTSGKPAWGTWVGTNGRQGFWANALTWHKNTGSTERWALTSGALTGWEGAYGQNCLYSLDQDGHPHDNPYDQHDNPHGVTDGSSYSPRGVMNSYYDQNGNIVNFDDTITGMVYYEGGDTANRLPGWYAIDETGNVYEIIGSMNRQNGRWDFDVEPGSPPTMVWLGDPNGDGYTDEPWLRLVTNVAWHDQDNMAPQTFSNVDGFAEGPQHVEDGHYASKLFFTGRSSAVGGTNQMYCMEFVRDAGSPTGIGVKYSPVFADGEMSVQFVDTDFDGNWPHAPAGIAFTPADYNLWHLTSDDPGSPFDHGIQEVDSMSFDGSSGMASWYFGIDWFHTGAVNWDAHDFSWATSFGDDNRDFEHTYNVPGGAQGALTSSTFSLRDYAPEDVPTLYFNYFAETEDDRNFDGLHVFASVDGASWNLIADNTSIGVSNVAHDETKQVQDDLVDVGGAWRQAHINLSEFAGMDNIRLRFDFSTAGDRGVGGANYSPGDQSNLHFTGQIVSGVPGYLILDKADFERDMNPDAAVQLFELPDGSLQTMTIDEEPQDCMFTIDNVDYLFAQGFSLYIPNVAGTAVRDGETISITDRFGTVHVFEFNKETAPQYVGLTDPSHIEITIRPDMTSQEIIGEIMRTIDAEDISVYDFDNGGNIPLRTYSHDNRIFLDYARDLSNTTPDGAPSEIITLGSYPMAQTASGMVYVRENHPVTDVNGDVHVRARADMTAQDIAREVMIAVNTTDAFSAFENRIYTTDLNNWPDASEPGWTMTLGDGSEFTLRYWERTAELVSPDPRYQLNNENEGYVIDEFAGGELQILSHAFLLETDRGPLGLNSSLEGDEHDSRDYEFDRFYTNDLAYDNHYEGFYIDDIIIGAAERGEWVTSATPNSAMDSIAPRWDDTRVVEGAYQLEIRQGESYYIRGGDDPMIPGYDYRLGEYHTPQDTNDRFDTNISVWAPAAQDIYHGQEFTIYDGITEQRFRFLDASHTGGGGGDENVVPIYFDATDSDYVIAGKIADAINTNTHPDTHVIDVQAKSIVSWPVASQGSGTGSNQVTDQADLQVSSNRVDLWGAVEVRGLDQTLHGVSANDARLGDFQYEEFSFSHLTADQLARPEYYDPATNSLAYSVEYVDAGITLDRIEFLGDDPRREDLWNVVGDNNHERQKGQIILNGNTVMYADQYGIRVAPTGDASEPAPASGRHMYDETGLADLVGGVTIQNNVLAYNGTGGILFSGAANYANGAVPFGRIVNNTLYGDSNATGTGINVQNSASPTLANNIVANFQTGVRVDNTSAAEGTVLQAMTFQGNNTNAQGTNVGNSAQLLTAADPLFVDAANENFYLRSGSMAIDSSTTAIEEREQYYYSVLEPLLVSPSPILSPETDRYGQVREDDPSVSSGSGTGGSVFTDRGAIDRVDRYKPTATVIEPMDNLAGVDHNPVDDRLFYLGNDLLQFAIQLNDGEGVGIDDWSVMRPDFTVRPEQLTLLANGVELVQDYHFFAVYNPTNNIIYLTPASGTWDVDTVYEIILNNDPTTGIRDMAANPLAPNHFDTDPDTGASLETVEFSITISGYDFGDAQTVGQTTDAETGAKHIRYNGYQLGDVVTLERDALINADATGDAGDDGVIFEEGLIAGALANPTIYVTANRDDRPDEGFLHAWFDWDGDGIFEEIGDNGPEHVIKGVLLQEGTNKFDPADPATNALVGLQFFVPNLPDDTQVLSRFRFTSDQSIDEPIGTAPDGEVEDYLLTVISGDPTHDYGDAPDSYQTRDDSDGARHYVDILGPQLTLGQTVDLEHDAAAIAAGQPGENESMGDNAADIADETGITFNGRLEPGVLGSLTVDYVNMTGGTAYLNTWIDWNADGDFDDAGEALGALPLAATGAAGTSQSLSITVPDNAAIGYTHARFRLSTEQTLESFGEAPDGEVEDYRIIVEKGAEVIDGYVFEDMNANAIWEAYGSDLPMPKIDLMPIGSGQVVQFTGIDTDNTAYLNTTQCDDLSSALLDFGFDFQFYGETYAQFYVNNNGSITFTDPSPDFIPEGFPQDTPRLAPFWADVDTTQGGRVEWQTGVSSRGNNFVQIDWIDVGYFDGHNDKTNTFSLYIEDDPNGDIVVYHYHDMQWTTGDSNVVATDGFGVDGFGSYGAQIGFDSGDGTNSLSWMRPNSEEDLRALMLQEEYAFRLTPTTGRPAGKENGLAGQAVHLYADLDDDGSFETLMESAITMADDPATPENELGYYKFDELYSGTYMISHDLLPDYFQTTPHDPVLGDNLYVTVGPGGDGTNEYDHIFGVFRRPEITIDDVTVIEGDTGEETIVEVTVHLKESFYAPITLRYNTSDGTASATEPAAGLPADYNELASWIDFTDPQNPVLKHHEFKFAAPGQPADEWDVESLASSILVESGNNTADVVILFDLSSSMGWAIDNTKANLLTLDTYMQAAGVDAQYALVPYLWPQNYQEPGGAGTYLGDQDAHPYLTQDLVDFATFTAPGSPFDLLDTDGYWPEAGSLAVLEALNRWDPQTYASDPALTPPPTTVSFRDGSQKMVLLITDTYDMTEDLGSGLWGTANTHYYPEIVDDALQAVIEENAIFNYIGLPGGIGWGTYSSANYDAMAAASGGVGFDIYDFTSDPTGFFDSFSQTLVGQVKNVDPEAVYDMDGDYMVTVWTGGMDNDVFLYNLVDEDAPVVNLTDNITEDTEVQISGDYVAWIGDDGFDTEVYLYQISTGVTTQITDNHFDEANIDLGDTLLTWETHYFTGSADTNDLVEWTDVQAFEVGTANPIKNLSNLVYGHDFKNDVAPKTDGQYVTWVGNDGKSDEIYVYDHATGAVTQVTDNYSVDRNVQISGTNIIWEGTGTVTDADWEIMHYDILTGTTYQITDNASDDLNPSVDGLDLVFEAIDPLDGDWDIYHTTLFSGLNTNLSDNATWEDGNAFVKNGEVVWEATYPGQQKEILHVTIGSERTPTNVSDSVDNDVAPIVHNGIVVWKEELSDGTVDLKLARMAEPEVTGTIQVVVNGDDDLHGVEFDEQFFLNIVGIIDTMPNEPGMIDMIDSQSTITIVNDDFGPFDFGDAPFDQSKLSEGGARHAVDSTSGTQLTLGTLVDTEDDALNGSNAFGDDIDNLDDEDGVNLTNVLFKTGVTTDITVDVMNTTGETAYLHGWIDFNANGQFDEWVDVNGNGIQDAVDYSERLDLSGSAFATALSVPTEADLTTYTLSIPVPAGIELDANGQLVTYARFRLTTSPQLEADGLALDGEVEDYPVFLVDRLEDFGDAPDSYGTETDSDGPRHSIIPGLHLGATVDPEFSARQPLDGTGDDVSGVVDPATLAGDEDGLTMRSFIEPGAVAVIDLDVTNLTGMTAYVNGWLDFDIDGDFKNDVDHLAFWQDLNGDGDYYATDDVTGELLLDSLGFPLLDAGESLPTTSIEVMPGSDVLTLSFMVPDTATAGATYARFRLTTDGTIVEPTGINADGTVPDGEVEDHLVTIERPNRVIQGYVYNDLNANGQWDSAAAATPIPSVTLNTVGTGTSLDFTLNNGQMTDAQSFGFVDGFRFYGESYDEFYVSADGAIFLRMPNTTAVPTEGLGDPNYPGTFVPMLAPFWADNMLPDGVNAVTTGDVQIQTGVSVRGNAFVQIDWIDVTFSDELNAPKNSFSVYIEDDPNGDIVVYEYYDMNWTTGQNDPNMASGFGGIAETGYHTGETTDGARVAARLTTPTDLVELVDNGQQRFRFDARTGEVVFRSAASGIPAITPSQPGSVVLREVDDTSSPAISLGFDFEFAGRVHDEFYVNPNGFVSFDYAPFGAYFDPAIGFNGQLAMIAPFWSDTDLRNAGGTVNVTHGISDRGNPFVQVNWVNVAYFDHLNMYDPWTGAVNTDARNNFGLYIEDDAAGDIVAFIYDDMNWTSGQLDSTSANGLGGYGAVIGFDAGNGAFQSTEMRPSTLADLQELETQHMLTYRFDPTNGSVAGNEPGMSGVEVYLDLDNDGTWDSDEPITTTFIDDPSTLDIDELGLYRFEGLYSGYYDADGNLHDSFTVRQRRPDDWLQTAPVDAGASPFTNDKGHEGIDLSQDQVSDFNDFGNFHLPELSMGDVTVVEGDEGTTEVTLEILLRESFGAEVDFTLRTQNGTAIEGQDFVEFIKDFTIYSQAEPIGHWETASLTQNDSNDYDFEVSHESLVYEAKVDGVWQVFVYNEAVGGQPVALTSGSNDSGYSTVLELGDRLLVSWATHDGDDYEVYFASCGKIDVDGEMVFDLESLAGNAVQVTNNDFDDKNPRLSETHMTWWGDAPSSKEIFLLAQNEIVDANGDGVSDNEPANISNSAYDNDYEPAIHGSTVVWYAITPVGKDIFMYDPIVGDTLRISEASANNSAPQVNGSYVVWEGDGLTSRDIFVYDLKTRATTVLEGVAGARDSNPDLSGKYVVWEGGIGTDRDIYLYDMEQQTGPAVISDIATLDEAPAIEGNRIAWRSYSNGEWNIVYRDLSVSNYIPLTISANGAYDWEPVISDELVVWRSNDDNDYEIVIAQQADPELTLQVSVTVTADGLEVLGDTNVELDEYFKVLLENATVEILNGTYALPVDRSESTVTILNDDGSAIDGGLLDFGDAPASYGTTLADNGARHASNDGGLLFLGLVKDAENDAQLARQDDFYGVDDEDGVTFVGDELLTGQIAELIVTASEVGQLDAWVDFNGDGDFDDEGEYLDWANDPNATTDGFDLVAGANTVYFRVPEGAVLGDSYARFRVSTEGGLSYNGTALDGEVEDYAVRIGDGYQAPETFELIDGILHVRGTEGSDVISLERGDQITIDVNGERQTFSPGNVTRIEVDGLGGDDMMTVVGSIADELISFAPGQVSISEGMTQVVVIDNIMDVSVYSGGGADTALFTDSAGNEVFTVKPGKAQMLGADFNNVAYGVNTITATATNGGYDEATITGTAGSDTLISTPAMSLLTGNGMTFAVQAFDTVQAEGAGGAMDQAHMSGDDRFANSFVGGADSSTMSGRGYRVEADNFGQVNAQAVHPQDVARLFDSQDDDLFVATDNSAVMTAQMPAVYEIVAEGFRNYRGYSTNGGEDIAILAEQDGDDAMLPNTPWHEFHYTDAQGLDIAYQLIAFEQIEDRMKDNDSDPSKTAEEVADAIFEDWGM